MCIRDRCKAYPDVFLPGWAMVDPWRGRKGLEEIEHAIKTLGLIGVKYQPPVQGFSPNDKLFYPIWDLLQSLGAPVLIHCGTTAIEMCIRDRCWIAGRTPIAGHASSLSAGAWHRVSFRKAGDRHCQVFWPLTDREAP